MSIGEKWSRLEPTVPRDETIERARRDTVFRCEEEPLENQPLGGQWSAIGANDISVEFANKRAYDYPKRRG